MIRHGVALLRLANSPNGCGESDNLEEFYVVVAEGRILPTRYMSYAEAFRYFEKFPHSDVA